MISGARQLKGCLGKGKSNLQSVPPSKSFLNGDMVATEGCGLHEGRSSREGWGQLYGDAVRVCRLGTWQDSVPTLPFSSDSGEM